MAKTKSGGLKGFLTRAGASFYAGGQKLTDIGYKFGAFGARVGFIVTTTAIVTLMPLIFEIGRESQTLEAEKSQAKDLRSQGFSDRQLEQMGFMTSAIRPPSVAMNN